MTTEEMNLIITRLQDGTVLRWENEQYGKSVISYDKTSKKFIIAIENWTTDITDPQLEQLEFDETQFTDWLQKTYQDFIQFKNTYSL